MTANAATTIFDDAEQYSAVVITGAAGWLGRSVSAAVREGLADCPDLRAPVFGGLPLRLSDIVAPGDDDGKSGGSFVCADLRNANDCRRLFDGIPPDALVLHCAGLIHPRRPSQLDEVNHLGAVNLFAAARTASARRVVALSSNSPCGTGRSIDERFDEQSPYRPYMRYGKSKMKMEMHIRAQVAPQWTIVRAPWFYGPHQPTRQTLFFQMIKNGKGPIVGGGDNLRSMAYTDNLAQGILRAALHKKAAGQLYWIADAEPCTMNQVVDTVEYLLETEFNIPCKRGRLRLPGMAAEVAMLCDFLLQSANLYSAKIHVLSEMNKTIACDIGKARRELGYHPAIALEEGMRRSIADLLERGERI